MTVQHMLWLSGGKCRFALSLEVCIPFSVRMRILFEFRFIFVIGYEWRGDNSAKSGLNVKKKDVFRSGVNDNCEECVNAPYEGQMR
jgi:hypothetical protein